ncbi:probable palmitoyltransferase ZDHHC24 [Pectinophora gossypiella]|uniref:probable palmitoyltransferase ZDHHC24 n=1 Tax=Pectinophora gossypiella TaxID=13191 RepID=UPI00214F3554|nr:probable palmitoyltransferase ZDHHC24 [Pectinophora gossypiella]XP_049870318.1 probable palmitoyltransferase ZDHHC24 [Pectinophora gossypiella]
MIIKVNSVKNRHLKRVLEHSVYIAIVVVLIPGLFYFEVFIVLPSVVEEWTREYCIHVSCAMFLLFNIIGNLIYGVFTDTSIKGKFLRSNNDRDWSLCAVCECYRPPRAWHCEMCNICVLKRDHHCSFFACCVGYFNHRYFMLFTMYVFIAMLYAIYFNIMYLSQFVSWNHGLVLMKFIFPIASFFIDFGDETLYVLVLVINLIIAAFTGFLFFYHLRNVIRGKTVPEAKHCKKDFLYDKGWKLNIIEVFGERWYLTWILPFIRSPLPGNGIEWNVEDKYK